MQSWVIPADNLLMGKMPAKEWVKRQKKSQRKRRLREKTDFHPSEGCGQHSSYDLLRCFNVSVESDSPTSCCIGTSHRYVWVTREITALAKHLLLEIGSPEFVARYLEVQTLLPMLRAVDLPLRHVAGGAVVEYLRRIFRAFNQSTKTPCFTVVLSLVLFVWIVLGALMTAHAASDLMLYPLMPQMTQEDGAIWLTEGMFYWTSILVDHGGQYRVWTSESTWTKCFACHDLKKTVGRWQQGQTVSTLVPLWLGFNKWSSCTEFRLVVKVVVLSTDNRSYTFDFSEIATGVTYLNESVFVLHCVCSCFSHVGRSAYADLLPAVVRQATEQRPNVRDC